jgi:hypothetical protein
MQLEAGGTTDDGMTILLAFNGSTFLAFFDMFLGSICFGKINLDA